jgi:phospholipid/cholesterol/gamma-HCH transport system ATP-binding protein
MPPDTPPTPPPSPSPPSRTKAKAPVVRVENLHAAYDDKTILKDITFEITQGEVFVLGGRSGSGKSTLLKHMIGLLTPAGGRILIDGQDVSQSRGEDRRRLLRTFGVTYQGGALFGSMTLLENVRLPLEQFTTLPADAMDVIALSKLHVVGLEESASSLPSQISGGMQKRAAIARAMALDPRILFLDEPSAGLDPITSAELDDLILDLRRMFGITFVVVSHELPSIFAVADRCLVLDASTRTMAALDTPQRLREQTDLPWVHSFFNRETITDHAREATA